MHVSNGQLITEVGDGIGWIIFDNQEKRNAISRVMLVELTNALDDFAADDAVRVVVLRGAGERAFTAGADITELGDQPIRISADNYDEGFAVRELREFSKPILAMIHGFCMGGGVILAMGADMRIGSDDSVYCIPVASLGVCYPIAAIDRLNQLVGQPLTFGDDPGERGVHAPTAPRGEHTDAVLRELGYDDDGIAALRARNVL